MGLEYGRQAREEIRQNAEFWLGAGRLKPTDAFVDMAHDAMALRMPEVLAELEGLAEGSGVELAALLAMNHVDTFGGCTSMAIGASPDGPVLGKNNDGEPDERVFVIRTSSPADGLGMIQVTYAGWLSGLDAMNAAGLANGHNSVGSVFEKTGPRVDIRLWAYHLMRRCRSAREFLDAIDDAPLTGKGFNVVLADERGDTCVLEAAVPLVACRDRGGDFVFATNHYVSDALKDADRRAPGQKEISIHRYGYLRWRQRTSPPKTAADVRGILASHEPWAPCRHGGAHEAFTLWSMIALPRARRLLVASGPPCTHEHAVISCDL